MFLILVNYKKSLEIVDQYLAEHRKYLAEGYKKNYYVVSGTRSPRTGGIILSQLKDRKQLEDIIQQDPFYLQHIADFEIIEFNPALYHDNFASFIQ
ncbi:MAG: YciI family protein [Gammaproteobacteria bacterium]|nr:YciI family protein [Gammaproteobacteria bacterium]